MLNNPSTNDSLHVEILKHSIDNLTKTLINRPDDNSAWLGFWSAILGGFLVIAGQYFIEFFKDKSAKKIELSNIISESKTKKCVKKFIP